jgi:hypothetical protein
MKLGRPPPPEETMVKDALLRALRQGGLEPGESWVSVQRVSEPWPWAGMYTVRISYQGAWAALSAVLRRIIRSGEKEVVGVWVLNESEARQLCAGAFSGAQRE